MSKNYEKILLKEYINDYLENNDMSIRAFAIKADLSKSYAHYLCKGERENAGVQVLKKIAHATDVSLEELLEKVVIDASEKDRRDSYFREIEKILNDINDENELKKILEYVKLYVN